MPSADRYETKDFKLWKSRLMALGNDVLPRVVAETINVVAGFAHVQSIRNVRDRFVLRNQYTERSIKFYKASPKKDWRRINAISGSISPYMDEQEAGGYRVPKQGSKVPEATLAARGGDSRRVVRKQYRAGSLGPKQFVGVPRGKVNGKTRPYGVYSRNRGNRYLVMIRNISRARVEIKGRHWHRDAVEFRYRREVLTDEFIRQAQREVARLATAK